ncbi:hypothetical protein C8R44DRAFT_871600 [Mycena epipterygia]|nr:hypothetical protein C8R44DRAFT_871600 [Mycena epipterygia]
MDNLEKFSDGLPQVGYPAVQITVFNVLRDLGKAGAYKQLQQVFGSLVHVPRMQSPFAQHLHTNYVPSDWEVKHIHAHIESCAPEVQRLDSLIQDLICRRVKLVSHLEAHKALISPVRRLPNDIVQEVFLACRPAHRKAVLCANEAPLVLTRICSAWRALALSTLALWTSLQLPLQYFLENAPLYKGLDRPGRSSLSSLSIIANEVAPQTITHILQHLPLPQIRHLELPRISMNQFPAPFLAALAASPSSTRSACFVDWDGPQYDPAGYNPTPPRPAMVHELLMFLTPQTPKHRSSVRSSASSRPRSAALSRTGT